MSHELHSTCASSLQEQVSTRSHIKTSCISLTGSEFAVAAGVHRHHNQLDNLQATTTESSQLKHFAATRLIEEPVIAARALELELDGPGSCRGLSAAWWSGPTHSRWTRTTRPPPAAAACQSSAPASRTPAAAWSDPATQIHITAPLRERLGGHTGTSFSHRSRTGDWTGNMACRCRSLAGHDIVLWVRT